ncbi:protein kinase [Spirillospora sp. NPDC029432]|uniref:serine/threonine-protein kinase n=1 Tax=Spirillospora sp. NPDC029432 TaxID=3154599 RepID=UPI003452B154
MTGERVLAGRYRLVQKLGQGAMGIVWRARDETLGRDVAVKELLLAQRLGPREREQAAQRAMREARAAALLKHKSIVTVHDVVLDEGRPCIVMDFLPGRSLDAVVAKEGPMPPDRAARVGLDILAALGVAHARGVLHRDVKPANIFLRDDGRAVLTDFGLAFLEGDTPLTQEGYLVGSPAFMAPERVRHEPSGPASDLWSLGATLYALTEGRTPFSRTSLMGTLGAVLTEEPAPPRSAGPLTPVILGLLVKDPAGRLTAERAAEALRALAAGEPTLPSTPLPPGPGAFPAVPQRLTVPAAAPPPKRRRWGRISAAVVACLAAAAAVEYAAGLVLDAGPGDPGTERPRATASGGASPTASATASVRFAAPPSPCGLITAEQATLLVPSFFTSNGSGRDATGTSRSCSWSTGALADGDDSLDVEVRAASGVADARREFGEQRRDATAVTKVTNIGGLGEAAFAHDAAGDSIVFFLVDNLTVEVRYESKRLDPYRQAVKAARWVHASIEDGHR